jgi:DNA-binding transcriptional regulator GbsR (MarR family)
MSDRPLTEREEELVDATNEYYARLAAITKKYQDDSCPGTIQERYEQMLKEIEEMSKEVEEKYG